MKFLALFVTVLPLAGGIAAARSGVPVAEAEPGSVEMAGGAASTEELVEAMLDALRRKDRDALRRLRVTEAEYRAIILPGRVEPGQPPRALTPQWQDYAWANLESRSHYHELRLLEEFGGHALRVKSLDFVDGTKAYAGYTAYRQLRLVVRDQHGEERELRTGSVVERGGRYKFMSFIRD